MFTGLFSLSGLRHHSRDRLTEHTILERDKTKKQKNKNVKIIF